jgi:thiosulfate/3-mercaptopyruvate sulfurtransferase
VQLSLVSAANDGYPVRIIIIMIGHCQHHPRTLNQGSPSDPRLSGKCPVKMNTSVARPATGMARFFSCCLRNYAPAPTTIAANPLSTSAKSGKVPLLLSGTDAVKLWKNNRESIKFLDASFHMNKMERNAKNEYFARHLPNAKFIDIDSAEFSDKSIDLPHMMPTEATFSASMGNLGINNDDHLVVYTNPGSFGAPRVWWMMKAFGHQRVSILEGGLTAWQDAGGEVEDGQQTVHKQTGYTAKLNSGLVAGWKDVLTVVETGSAQIVDARASARFQCKAPEPRPGLPMGHIPGSLNVPFTSVVQANDFTRYRSKEEIARVFEEAGLIRGSKIIASCGSGVTAAVLVFGLHLIGFPPSTLQIYDGIYSVLLCAPILTYILYFRILD